MPENTPRPDAALAPERVPSTYTGSMRVSGIETPGPRPTHGHDGTPHVLTPSAIVGIAVLGLATFFAITTELMPVGLLGVMSSDLGVS